MEYKKIHFGYELVTGNKNLILTEEVVQVGFINYSNRDIFWINDFPLYPVDKTAIPLSDINLHLLWMPILEGERDRTNYELRLKSPTADQKALYVFYKMIKR